MDFTFVDIEPNTPEHFEFRKGKIGGSHAPAIMGMGFCTALELWEEIVFNKERPKTAAMQRGIDLEPKARDWANSRLKAKYEPKIIQSIKHPWRIASLDGFYKKDGEMFFLEIKCPGVNSHETALAGEIPSYYMPQLQHTMDVANVDEMKYCSFDGETGVIINVERDKVFCEKLLKAEEEFYKCIIDHIPPDATVTDWVHVDDARKIDLAGKRKQMVELIKKLEVELKEIDDDLIKDLPHPRCLIGTLKVQKIMRLGAIDYKSIEALQELDLNEYRKPSTSYWKIS